MARKKKKKEGKERRQEIGRLLLGKPLRFLISRRIRDRMAPHSTTRQIDKHETSECNRDTCSWSVSLISIYGWFVLQNDEVPPDIDLSTRFRLPHHTRFTCMHTMVFILFILYFVLCRNNQIYKKGQSQRLKVAHRQTNLQTTMM